MYDGEWKMDDESRKLFERLLALCEEYKRVNQLTSNSINNEAYYNLFYRKIWKKSQKGV